MPKYRLLVNGRNFFIAFDGKPDKRGFYQTIFVESSTPAQAERDAVEMIKSNVDLGHMTLSSIADPPVIHVEEIEEISSFDGIDTLMSGRAFYDEESSSG